jgi:O-methyltransferase involved in polyketide biosynthesis
MSDRSEAQASPTAQESSGVLGLGKSGGHRSAEMLAGIRAELMPKPEYIAMSRPAGRVIGGMLMRLASGDRAKINIVVARPESFRYLIAEALKDRPDAHCVELASGFLPRPWQLAREFPQLRVTEIDLPEVIAEKQRRFARAKLDLPPNLRMRSADLGVVPLTEVLEGEKADVITAEGLLPYFPLHQVQHIAAGVRQSLKADGVFIADILLREGVQELLKSKARQAANMFRRNAGEWLGVIEDRAHAEQLFKALGYVRVEFYKLSELAERLPHVPKPVSDTTLLLVAYNS